MISKGTETMKTILTRNKSLVEDYKHKQGRSASSSIASLDKVRCDHPPFLPHLEITNGFSTVSNIIYTYVIYR